MPTASSNQPKHAAMMRQSGTSSRHLDRQVGRHAAIERVMGTSLAKNGRFRASTVGRNLPFERSVTNIMPATFGSRQLTAIHSIGQITNGCVKACPCVGISPVSRIHNTPAICRHKATVRRARRRFDSRPNIDWLTKASAGSPGHRESDPSRKARHG